MDHLWTHESSKVPGASYTAPGPELQGVDLKNWNSKFSSRRENLTTISIKKSRNFHDPWVGTDTTGPGEAVSAIGGANLEGIT